MNKTPFETPAGQQRQTLRAYIMCGGGGTRLWPISRADNPKQNLKLSGDDTMLGETIARIDHVNIPGIETTINLMGNQSQFENMLDAQTRQNLQCGTIITEPFGKNTAAAVAVAALHSQMAREDDPYVLILPSDHIIEPVAEFSKAIVNGLAAADDEQIVIFGIKPNSPATGYGYIEAGNLDPVASVKSFREKPDLETASHYLQSGQYLWNAGIFLFRASTMITALETHAPDILSQSQDTLRSSEEIDGHINLDPQTFQTVPANSIDFAVMEHAKNVTVVRAEFDWHDIGSFASLKKIQPSDEDGNIQSGDVVSHDCSNSLLHSEGPMIAAIGLDNISVVSTRDVTLITPLDRSEEVKHIVKKLKDSGRLEISQSPWLNERGAVPGRMKSVLRNWLMDDALPFWAKHGLDLEHGGFHEVLDFSGRSTGVDKRLRTMARQIFVYGKAIEMGWQGDAAAIVHHGMGFLKSSPTAPKGGWCKTFSANSQPLDQNEDAYDHAFILLALAQTRKAGLGTHDELMDRLMGTVDRLRLHSVSGEFNGYAEDSAGTLPRRSNPHMHLLEAFLAYFEASNDPQFLKRAGEIVTLFETRFFDAENLLLGEAFDEDLKFTNGQVSLVEPGHHFEWVHLLHRYAGLSGKPPSSRINGLFAGARAWGINPVTELAYDEVNVDAVPSHHSARCWVQTELLSCLSVLTNRSKTHLRYDTERSAQRLWSRYIKSAPTGMWIDVVDGKGDPVSKSVPASTFYHLIGCIDHYTKNIDG